MAKITSVSIRFIILAVMTNAIALGLVQAQVIEDGRIGSSTRGEAAKITLGVVEDVILSPWGINFPARIDTGADLSSLDARDIVVRQDVAEFRLGADYGRQRLQLPIVEWGHVQTSMGIEKRPIVEISICLGSKLLRTLATLKDRSGMAYPFLVGRSTLSGSFLVDTSRSRAAQPSCPAGAIVSN